MINIKYKTLFQIKIVLQDYAEALINDIEVVPTDDTKDLFTNYRLKFTSHTDTIYVFSEVVGTNKNETRITLPTDIKFEFCLKFRNTKFKTFYSNLSGFDIESQVLLFDNKTAVKSGTDLFLSRQYVNYAAANTYEKGYLAAHSGNLFMAVAHSDSGSPANTSDTNFWKQVTKKEYVNQENLVARNTIKNISNDDFGKIEIYNSGIAADFIISKPIDISSVEDIAAGRTVMGTEPAETQFTLQFKNYKIS